MYNDHKISLFSRIACYSIFIASLLFPEERARDFVGVGHWGGVARVSGVRCGIGGGYGGSGDSGHGGRDIGGGSCDGGHGGTREGGGSVARVHGCRVNGW